MDFLNWRRLVLLSRNARPSRQIWRAMRLTTLLLITAFIQVSAKGIAQEKITLELKNAPIEKVFTEIRKATGYDFFYDDATVKNAKPVTIKVKDASLKEVLDECFKGQGLSYSITGNAITVEPKPKTSEFSSWQDRKSIDVKGRVINEKGEAIVGANVTVKGTNRGAITDNTGEFVLVDIDENAVLQISHVNIEPFEIKVNGRNDLAVIQVNSRIVESEKVIVVANTGYQVIPLHQATGSVDVINNKQITTRPSLDLVSRIDGWSPGVLLDRRDDKSITIRGRSTIFSNDQPAIILDNFPYDGDINNINPNDIESITILKDAAAAAIWGVRAGNGVIVITTKRGKYGQEPIIEFNSNISTIQKPDLSSVPSISSADFIEVEKMLFDNGYYNNFEANQQFFSYPFSPVVELLIAKRDNLIQPSEADSKIAQLKNIDVRKDFEKYFYRAGFNQQYAFNVRGGTPTYKYYLSAGYDKNLLNLVSKSSDRVTFKANNTFTPAKNLEVEAGILFTQYKNVSGNNSGFGGLNLGWGYSVYPYAQFADDRGNLVPIIKDHRLPYDLISKSLGLLDWTYNPIADIDQTKYSNKNSDFTLNAGVGYKIFQELKVEFKYQYERAIIGEENLKTNDSYEARDLVNKFTQLDQNGNLSRIIPIGGILTSSSGELESHQLRGYVSYNRIWRSKHEISAIAGTEVKDLSAKSNYNQSKYGYDERTGNSFSIYDYTTTYPMFDNQFDYRSIGYSEQTGERVDRFFSYFANAGYTYLNRYTITGSGRIDASNFFGVRANQRKVPLWSTGFLWHLSEEGFYKIGFIPKLSVRISYGYNGNINKSVTAFTTARAFNSVTTSLPYLLIINPPNEQLRWEKVKILNTGLDFQVGRKSFLTGNIQFYWKEGIDLIGSSPLDPTSGFISGSGQSVFTGNVANMKARGLDIAITSRNINGAFKWYTDLIFSYATSKVTSFATTSTLGRDFISSDMTISPLIGKPLFTVFSYGFAGLDPATGDPRGYLDKNVSTDYGNIIGQTQLENMVYHGPGYASAPYFGNLRNTFSYKGFSLFVNLSYRFGYYFRRSTISYGSLYANWRGHKDFERRWKNPGDELFTNVPSMVYPANAQRDAFYRSSEAVVEKGDHIRLNEMSLSYELSRSNFVKAPFRSLRFTVYAGNIGLLWKANDADIDPFYNGSPTPGRTMTFAINASF